MIRLTFLLRRHPDLDRAAFQRYWLDEHGPLVAGHAGDLEVIRYVQVHTIDDPSNGAMAVARGGMEPPYDGVAELWFENREALLASMDSAKGRAAGRALLDDEATFIDLSQSPLWISVEHPQVNPTPESIVADPAGTVVSCVYPLRCPTDVDEPEAQRYWHQHHGPLIRRLAPALGLQRYVQVHRVPDELEHALRRVRGTTVDGYMGHAELWFDSADRPSASERREANRLAVEDEARFIDFARSSMWLAKEHVLVDRR